MAKMIWRVNCSNTYMTGERRTYYFLANSAGEAETKAISKMDEELQGERGRNFALSVNLMGDLSR